MRGGGIGSRGPCVAQTRANAGRKVGRADVGNILAVGDGALPLVAGSLEEEDLLLLVLFDTMIAKRGVINKKKGTSSPVTWHSFGARARTMAAGCSPEKVFAVWGEDKRFNGCF